MRLNLNCRMSVLAAVLVAATASSTPIVERPWGAAVQRIQKAASLTDARERDAALRSALQQALLEADDGGPQEVIEFLGLHVRWIDLRPFADLLERFDRAHPGGHGASLLGDSEWCHLGREERLVLYRTAIVEGSAPLRAGARPMIRSVAVRSAAAEGLAELKPLIGEYYQRLPPEDQTVLPLPQLMLTLDLRSGADDADGAVTLAIQRVAAMADEVLARRMLNEADFREVVLRLAGDSCLMNPFTHVRNAGCKIAQSVYGRLNKLASGRDQVSAVAPTGSTPVERSPDPMKWLGTLRASVGY